MQKKSSYPFQGNCFRSKGLFFDSLGISYEVHRHQSLDER
jgi:hypothetical protein